MNNIMLDLETLSSAPDACIVAIGAATFSSDGADQDKGFIPRQKFYAVVDPQSAQDAGGVITARTVQWWAKQSDAARAVLNDSSAIDINNAVRRFAGFCLNFAEPAAPAERKSRNSPSKAVKKTDASVAPARQRILDAIAWLQSIGHATPDRTLVALLAGASPTSSTFTNNLGAMRGAGLIDYPAGGCVALTEAGARRAAPPQQALTHAEMMAKIGAHVSPAQRRLLDALCAAYPKPMVKERLAEAVGASPTSSAFTNNLGRLRSLGLITYPIAGAARADDRLFPERRA